MELTKREKAYLEFYKGENIEEALYEWKGELSFHEKGFYLVQLTSGIINAFLNFLNNPKDSTLASLDVYKLDMILMMIMTLSEVACKCALEDVDTSGKPLYRYEHQDNIESYDKEYLCGFKSTSYSCETVEAFNDGEKTLLEFYMNGFCPYIPVNKLTNQGMLNDEHECLFPPYINCHINGNNVDLYLDEQNDLYDIKAFDEAEKSFVEQLNEDKKNGVVSDKLKEYCKHINTFLKYSIKSLYQKYNNIYNENKESIK